MRSLLSICSVVVLCAFLASCGSSSTSPGNTNNNNSSGRYSASGSVTLVVHCNNDAVLDQGNGYINTKTDVSTSSLVISCGSDTSSGSAKSFQWQDATLSGTASEAMYEKIQYPCNSGTGTDYDTTINSFNSASDGIQPAGAQLTINGNSYGITATGAWKGQPMHVYTSHFTDCGANQFTNNSNTAISVPFESYFSPFFGGNTGSLTGTIDPSNPNHITGTLHGTQAITLYTNGTTSYTVPLDIVISWSFTLVPL